MAHLKTSHLEDLDLLFRTHKESRLLGRYVSIEMLVPLIEKLKSNFVTEIIGTSVLGIPISSLKIGSGKHKILLWSQMHGNESTTTKALFDLCNTLAYDQSYYIKEILKQCTILIIPMLNPDGAKVYTRVNANNVDLNRDAQELSQPESRALRAVFDNFKPDFCFNLHGQRTIFSAGQNKKPATVSFLSPAANLERDLTPARKAAMALIVSMNTYLQNKIPHQIGRYDDGFNLNCLGDTFHSLNVPTVLFEAGHYAKDYSREVVRGLIYQSYLVALASIVKGFEIDSAHDKYLMIPENKKLFYDCIIRNALIGNNLCDLAFQFEEQLIGKSIDFIPIFDKIIDDNSFFAHNEIDAKGAEVILMTGEVLSVSHLKSKIRNVYINDIEFSIYT